MGDPVFENDIRKLVAGNRKIEAVKIYRERTGLGLADAKSAVEAIAEGRPLPARWQVKAPDDLPAFEEEPVTVDETLEDVLRRLIANGQKIEAIKLVRERTGLGLAEAKKQVDALEAGGGSFSASAPRQPVPGATGTAALDAELRALITSGRKIEAIKLHRERTKSGLADAKHYVDALESGGSASYVPALAAAPAPVVLNAASKVVFPTASAPKPSVSGYEPRVRKPFSESPTTNDVRATSSGSGGAWVVVFAIVLVTFGAAVVWFARG